ncbi:MAG TPA: sulfotransferase domain-containing protein [Caulobacteraceae bacterium]
MGRALSMEELSSFQGRMMGLEDIMQSLASYRPRPTDVVISPFGRCGTTWLQQVFHCLRTGGDMDFDDISRVVPWIEAAELLGLDINAEQRAQPRGYKSHLAYPALPAGARYVVSLRDPRDAVVSMHELMEGWLLEPGAVSADLFASWWTERNFGNNWWAHFLSWWEQRDNPDVLLLSYEHMVDDPALAIRRLAAFCGLPLDDDLLARTLERSSRAYMLRHKDKFDDLMIREASERLCGLPPGSDSSKVRNGVVGRYRDVLAHETIAILDRKWAAVVAPATGLADYAALDAALRARATEPVAA